MTPRVSFLGHTALLSAANEDTSNCTTDTADEIMERIVKSATQGPSQRTQPRERRRSRANRKSRQSANTTHTSLTVCLSLFGVCHQYTSVFGCQTGNNFAVLFVFFICIVHTNESFGK